MAENELERRLEKKILAMQQVVNKQEVYIKRLHGQLTHPSVLARVKIENKSLLEDIMATLTNYATMDDLRRFTFFYGA